MKKMLTFLFAGMLALMVSASANASQVILNARTNYEIQIDGRTYNNGVGTVTINDLNQGSHTVNVYQVVSNGVFGIGKKRNLISTQQFNLGAYDVYVDVDQNGQVRINQNSGNNQNGGYGDNNNRNRNGGYNHDRDNTNAGPGNSDWGHQQGKKKGHYKNKKNKHNKHDDDDNDRYDRNDRNDNYRRGNN